MEKVCAFTTSRGVEQDNSCQFNIPEHELIEFDGKCWCKFHLPMCNEKGKPSCKSEWVTEPIAGESVPIDTSFFQEVMERSYIEVYEGHWAYNLVGVVFPNSVYLTDFIFKVGAVFAESYFNDGLHFEGVAFNSGAWFDEAKIRNAVFNRCQFRGEAFWFNDTETEAAQFEECIFNPRSKFHNMQCSQWVSFRNSIFNNSVDFKGCIINGKSLFSGCEFHGYANFKKVKFIGDCDFSAIPEVASDSAKKMVFNKIDFDGAVFNGKVKFTSRHFRTSTSFKDVIFNIAPEFFGCEIHQDTVFTAKGFLDTNSEHSIAAYSALKMAMAKNNSRRDEGLFYALEQKSLANKLPLTNSIKWMAILYGLVSDYGRSISRPFWCYLISVGIFFAIYLLFFSPLNLYRDNYLDIISFTIEQSVRPLSVWTIQEPITWNVRSLLCIKLVASLQSLTSLALLALLLLAIRWNFKKE